MKELTGRMLEYHASLTCDDVGVDERSFILDFRLNMRRYPILGY